MKMNVYEEDENENKEKGEVPHLSLKREKVKKLRHHFPKLFSQHFL
jgi:hypothetical protein